MYKFFILSFLFFIISSHSYAQKQKDWRKMDKFPDSTVDEDSPDLVVNSTYNFTKNPALAGFEKRNNISIGFNNISPNWSRAYSGYDNDSLRLFYYDMRFAFDRAFLKKRNLGVGLYSNLQQIGINKSSELNLSLSYLLKDFGNTNLRIGLSGSLFQKSLGDVNYTWSDMIEPRAGFVNASMEPWHSIGAYKVHSFYTINTGLFLNRKDLNIGLSFFSINKPIIGTYDDYLFIYKKRNVSLYTNYSFIFFKKIKLSPVIDMSLNSDNYLLKTYLLISYFDKIMLGYTFNTYNSTLFENGITGGLNMTNHIQLTASYSKAGIKTKYQLGLLIQFGKTKKDLTKWRNF